MAKEGGDKAALFLDRLVIADGGVAFMQRCECMDVLLLPCHMSHNNGCGKMVGGSDCECNDEAASFCSHMPDAVQASTGCK